MAVCCAAADLGALLEASQIRVFSFDARDHLTFGGAQTRLRQKVQYN